ncbi:MAG: hypothetical protein ACRDTT_16840, partial [Pseudonocardiaceae bacterium]
RLALHQRLEAALGGEAAMTLMQHLPPGGSTDVATKGDIGTLELRFDGLEARFDGLERRMDRFENRMDRFETLFTDQMDRLETLFTDQTGRLESRFTDQTGRFESRFTDQTDRFESRFTDQTGRFGDQMERLHQRMDIFHQELRGQTRVYILAMLGAMATNTSIIVAAIRFT